MPPIREPRTAEARAHRDRVSAVLEVVAQVCDQISPRRTGEACSMRWSLALQQRHFWRLPPCACFQSVFVLPGPHALLAALSQTRRPSVFDDRVLRFSALRIDFVRPRRRSAGSIRKFFRLTSWPCTRRATSGSAPSALRRCLVSATRTVPPVYSSQKMQKQCCE